MRHASGEGARPAQARGAVWVAAVQLVNRTAGDVTLHSTASPRVVHANQSCDSGFARGSACRRPKPPRAGHAGTGSPPAHRTAVRRRARRQHTRRMHTRLLRVIHARHLGAVLQVADKRKRVHVALAVVHLRRTRSRQMSRWRDRCWRAARYGRGEQRAARLCVVNELAALQHAPVASPQHTAGLHFRLRHIHVEPAPRRGA